MVYNLDGDIMNIITKETENEIEIKKSKFICLLYYVNNEEKIKAIFNKIPNIYKGATHYCYAYITSDKKKFSDDNEPSGTAGMPICNVLEKNDLTNILAIVIRFFGGIKLGAGGLIRAYTKVVTEALKKTDIIPYKKYLKVILETDYENQKLIDKISKKYNIIEKNYDKNIKYSIEISKEELEILKNNIDKKIQIIY